MEEDSGFIYKTVAWIGDHRGFLKFLSIFAVVLIACLYIFNTYAILIIEADSSTNTTGVVVYTGSELAGEEMKKAGGLGMLVIPRNTQSIVVGNGDNINTRISLNIPWYGVVEKKVALLSDKDAEKMAYRSSSASICALYRPKSDKLAYYNCQKPNAGLFEYQTSVSKPWFLKKVSPLYYPLNNPEPGSYLGIQFTSPAQIIGINEQNKEITYNAPPLSIGGPQDSEEDEITDLHNVETAPVRIYSDNNDTTNHRFVVVSRSGDIFIGTPTGGRNVTYDTIDAPSDYRQSYNQTLCTVNTDYVYCYRGPAEIGDTSSNYDFSKATKSQVIVYSLADKIGKTYNLSKNLFTLSSIHATEKGEVFGYRFGDLYHFNKSGDVFDPTLVSKNVSSVAASDNLYYANNNRIYMLDQRDASVAHQVFYSSNVRPKAIYPVDGKVFIIGTTPHDSNTTFAYKLLNRDNPGNRLIDRLPFDSSSTTSIISNDLVSNRLYVVLSTPFVRTSKGKKIDTERFSQIKSDAETYIQRQNFSGITIQYSN